MDHGTKECGAAGCCMVECTEALIRECEHPADQRQSSWTTDPWQWCCLVCGYEEPRAADRVVEVAPLRVPKIKRYVDDESLSWEERYQQLQAHHEKETTWYAKELDRIEEFSKRAISALAAEMREAARKAMLEAADSARTQAQKQIEALKAELVSAREALIDQRKAAKEAALGWLKIETERMYRQMQTPEGREACERLFKATPDELGEMATVAKKAKGSKE